MRKNDLIKMLQSIKGNPEVMLYNSLVQDWMHFSKQYLDTHLVKESFELYWSAVRGREDMQKAEGLPVKACSDEYLSAMYSKATEWRIPDVEDFTMAGLVKKRVVLLQTANRGNTYCDRVGKIGY